MAATKKTVVAVAAGVFALGAGIGVAGLASADPTTTPPAPTATPSAGPDRPGGHRGPGRGAHGRLDGDLAAGLAKRLGVTEDKVTTALTEIRDAARPDPGTVPDPTTRPDPAARDAELAKALAGKLGVDEAKIKTALEEIRAEHTADRAAALKEKLAAAVKAGTLTQAEADAVQKAFDKGVINWR